MPSRKSSLKLRPSTALPVAFTEWRFEAIGTAWWIGLYEPIGDDAFAALQDEIVSRIEAFNKTYSRFRDDSLVSTIAAKAGSYQLPPDADKLLTFYRQLYDATDGQVTPLIGQVLSDAGYDASYSLRPGTPKTPQAWDNVLTYVSGRLVATQPVLLDFGAAGKGYMVDIVAELLERKGIKRYCVDASGDMLCHGLDAPLRIGLENPDDTSQAIGVIELQDGALCGSAGNRRSWGGYHHIIDPKSLDSPIHIKSLWVKADSALVADGLATALFFESATELLKSFTFSYLILYADGSVQQSSGFSVESFVDIQHA